MIRTLPILILTLLSITSSSHAQILAQRTETLIDNANWIKSKIEKYGGNQRKELSYKVEFDEKSDKLTIIEKVAGTNITRFKYTMSICDFKEVRRNGLDIEILANGTSIIGSTGINSQKESVWSGIKINHFVQAESNIVNKLHNAFKSLSESPSSNCN